MKSLNKYYVVGIRVGVNKNKLLVRGTMVLLTIIVVVGVVMLMIREEEKIDVVFFTDIIILLKVVKDIKLIDICSEVVE